LNLIDPVSGLRDWFNEIWKKLPTELLDMKIEDVSKARMWVVEYATPKYASWASGLF